MIRNPRTYPLKRALTLTTLVAAVVVAGHPRGPESPPAAPNTPSESAETSIVRTPGAETTPAVLSLGTDGDPPYRAQAAPPVEGPAVEAASSVAIHPTTATLPGSAGMITGLDPETGRPGKPTASQRAAMRMPDLDRSSDGLRETRRPDGTRVIELEGRFQEYAIVRILPDGRKEQSCVQGPMLEDALGGAAPPSRAVGTAGDASGIATAPGATVASEER
jgi:hypothetical protein